MKLEKIKAST